MKSYYLNALGNDGEYSVKKLIEFINENEEELTIYLTKIDAPPCYVKVLIGILNDNKERITLKAVGIIKGTDIDLFFNSNCKKEIEPYCQGMYYFFDRYAPIQEMNYKKNEYNEYVEQLLKYYHQETLQFIEKLGFNESETHKIKQKEHVYINYERLCEMLKHYQNEPL